MARWRARATARRGARTSSADRAAVRTAALRLPRSESGRTGSGRPASYSNLTNLTGHVTRRRGCRQLTGLVPVVRSAGLAGDQFLKPFAMMFPRPTAGDLPARHGADRTAQPDRRIDVYDPHTNDGYRGKRMDQDRPPLLLDARQRIEILIPDDDAGADQNDDQNATSTRTRPSGRRCICRLPGSLSSSLVRT